MGAPLFTEKIKDNNLARIIGFRVLDVKIASILQTKKSDKSFANVS